jgi:hypothetical protein
MMKLIPLSCVALLAGLTACGGNPPHAAPNQMTAGSSGSLTAYGGAAPNISPNDPAYSENGAPRAGQPAGTDTAGAPNTSGNYAPLQRKDGVWR